MPSIRLRAFRTGLWIAGPSDDTPSDALRRAVDVHPNLALSLRTRFGSALVLSAGAHSLFRFADKRVVGSGVSVLLDGVAALTGLNGHPLTCVRMPPQPNLADYLFIAGGGSLWKISPTESASRWGIVAPATNPTAADNGAGVLNGDYSYRVTFLNATTGSRSNGNPTAATIAGLTNRQVRLTGVPVSTDAQVTRREIWRTVGNGTLWFKCGEVADNTTTIFDDNVADLDLGSTELPDDNDPPSASFQTAAGPYGGRMLWARDTEPGARGRLYYSPVGRPESVEGFIEVTNDDDPTQTIVVWSGSAWVVTEGRIFQVLGTGPMTSRPMAGAPGTSSPASVVASPYGLLYQGRDGIRVFTGVESRLVGYEALRPIFTGESAEGVPPLGPIVAAAVHRDEGWLSDGVTTLILNLNTMAWRRFGVGVSALYSEPDTGQLLGATSSRVLSVELDGTTDDAGSALAFEAETPAARIDESSYGVAQRLYVDAETSGQSVTPTLLVDDQPTVLPPFAVTSRQTVEYALTTPGRRFAVRLTAQPTAPIEVFSIRLDVYVPSISKAVAA